MAMTTANDLAVGQESVQKEKNTTLKAVSCSRKELEEAISLLINKSNAPRKALVSSLYFNGLNANEKARLLDLVSVGRKEHAVLKALFDKLDWTQKNSIDQEKSQIFPNLLTIQEATNLSSSSVSEAKTRLQELHLISWRNRYRQDKNGENKSTSNQYVITERVLHLGEFTKIALKKELDENERERLKSIVSELLATKDVKKSGHQKSGLHGAKKKKFQENTKRLLGLAVRELHKGPSLSRFTKCIKVLDRVSERMSGLAKEPFDMSNSSRVNPVTPGFQVLEGGKHQSFISQTLKSGPQESKTRTPGVQNLDPQAPDSGGKYYPMNVPSRMSPLNLTTTTQKTSPEKIVSSFLDFNFFESRGLKGLTKKKFEEDLPSFLANIKGDPVKKITELLAKIQKKDLMPVFTYTFFSLKRLEHDNDKIVWGLKNDANSMKEYFQRDSLLNFPNLIANHGFETDTDAMKSIFPVLWEKQQALKKSVLESSQEDFPEDWKNEFLASEDFENTVFSKEIPRNFLNFIFENKKNLLVQSIFDHLEPLHPKLKKEVVIQFCYNFTETNFLRIGSLDALKNSAEVNFQSSLDLEEKTNLVEVEKIHEPIEDTVEATTSHASETSNAMDSEEVQKEPFFNYPYRKVLRTMDLETQRRANRLLCTLVIAGVVKDFKTNERVVSKESFFAEAEMLLRRGKNAL